MLGEKRGESLFFQAEKAAEPKIVEMGPQTVERGIQAVEFHQPDHSGISATGTLHHPQKRVKGQRCRRIGRMVEWKYRRKNGKMTPL